MKMFVNFHHQRNEGKAIVEKSATNALSPDHADILIDESRYALDGLCISASLVFKLSCCARDATRSAQSEF